MRLPCKPAIITGSGRLEAISDAVAASQIQMDAALWFELLETVRGYEVALAAAYGRFELNQQMIIERLSGHSHLFRL
jgi:hypothetical protein